MSARYHKKKLLGQGTARSLIRSFNRMSEYITAGNDLCVSRKIKKEEEEREKEKEKEDNDCDDEGDEEKFDG